MEELSTSLPNINNCKIAVLGLGYVGLPLAIEFCRQGNCLISGKQLSRFVIAFDINETRIENLRNKYDYTNQFSKDELHNLNNILFTSDKKYLMDADAYIITVPTPIDEYNNPDLTALKEASILVGKSLPQRKNEKKPVIIYESTVYPGATEETCIPILSKYSSLIYNKDFFCGYSPERINPGDKEHTLTNIVKVTSGSDHKSAEWIDNLYGSIISAGTHRVDSIKIAEAAKIIENTQRDINIALMNELSIICKLLEIDTLDVISAASTKWNFLPFKPGLVGGHCIGVDPHYLKYKSKQLGYSPLIVNAGRKINDDVSTRIVDNIILYLVQNSLIKKDLKILILGITFKEDCPDTRNSKVFNIINRLLKFPFDLTVVDPYITDENASQLNIKCSKNINFDETYDTALLLVAHKEFKKLNLNDWQEIVTKEGLLFDLKGIIPRELNPLRI